MNHARTALLALAALLPPACTSPKGQEPAPVPAVAPLVQRPARVVGTALDASTGERLAGVLVTGPGGARATTDDGGRFVLEGLRVGQRGELVAETRDGRRRAVLKLRPLAAGTLEVVVHLTRA